MSYNTDLQTNNTSLQDVLTSIQNLSSGRSYNTETWELTMTDGSVVEEEVKTVAISLITFTIDGVEYTAIEGMTWGEWVESEYYDSSDGFSLIEGCREGCNRVVSNGHLEVKETNESVLWSDVIYSINYASTMSACGDSSWED